MKTKQHTFRRSPANLLVSGICLAMLNLLVGMHQAEAQLVVYDFTGATGSQTSQPTASVAANMTASALGEGSGITPVAAAGSINASGWTTAASVDLNDYFTFTLTPNSGFALSLGTLSFAERRSGTGIRNFSIRTSLDSFAADVFTASVPDDTANRNQSFNFATNAAFTNIASAVTIRIYGYSSESAGGTWRLINNTTTTNMQLTGTVFATGGGATDYFWAGNGTTLGGSGTWNTSNTNWSATNSPVLGIAWESGKKAIFTNSAGTVTVGTVTASNGLQFASTGYVLTSGTLTLGGTTQTANTIATDTGVTTTVGSTLAGSAGLTKSGAGTLVLTASNTLSGGIAINGGGLSVSSDGNLGAAGNDVALGGGTLVVTSGFTADSGRDFTGSGSIDIAPSQVLQVDGLFNMSALTLTNTGTLDLNGATRNVGALTLGGAATIDASGAITVTSIDAAGLTSGTATINNAIAFSATGDRNVNVGAGGRLVVEGNVSGLATNNRIVKLGAGTLVANGSNTGGYRLGAAGTTNGGTLVLGSAAAVGANTLQFNWGTLEASSAMTITNDLSIGGREGTAAVVGGTSAIEFSGNVGWFNTNATTTNSYLGVNNSTTLSGVISNAINTNVVGGLKLVVGGAGTLTMSGASANSFTNDLVLTNTVTVNLNKSANTTAVGGNVTVNSGATLLVSTSGQVADTSVVTLSGGTISRASGVSETFGDLNLTAASTLDYVGGTSGTLAFGIYEGNATPDFKLTINSFFMGNKLTFANDLSAYIDAAFVGTSFSNDYFAINGMSSFGFESSWNGSTFTITAVPEPSTIVAALGLTGLLLWPARRRILKDTQRILGLRGSMRDRLARLRA